MIKVCSKCKEEKDIGEFSKDKSRKDGLYPQCKSCVKQYREENKESILEHKKQYREKNKESISGYQKQYYEENKESIKQYNEKNKESILEYQKQYYEENKESILEHKKQYREDNKESRLEYANQYTKNRRRIDPEYRLHRIISGQVNQGLKSQGSSKKGSSISKHLGWTMQEARDRIESLWEPWMNWENHGRANSKKRTWHIDHIIPRSKLPYDSMDHPNFKKCWALENLRPLEAIENIKKGNKDV